MNDDDKDKSKRKKTKNSGPTEKANKPAKKTTNKEQSKTDTDKEQSAPLKEKERLKRLLDEAKAESSSEASIPGYTSITARKALIDRIIILHYKGSEISEKTLRYVMKFFISHPEAVNGKYVRFLVPTVVELFGYPEAIKLTNELANELEDSKYGKQLKEYGKWLDKQHKIDRIVKLKRAGMNNTQIGEKLNISSADVAILADGHEKFVFRDEETRYI